MRHSTPEKQAELEARLLKLEQPTPLYRKGESEPCVWSCGWCQCVVGTEEQARRHYPCLPIRCEHGLRPGNETCRDCNYQRAGAVEEARVAKAVPVLLADWRPGQDHEEDYLWVDDERVHRDDWPSAGYGWPSKKECFADLDGAELLHDAYMAWDDGVDHDGCDPPSLTGVDEIAEAIERWAATQTMWKCEPDYGTVVMFPGDWPL